MTNKEICTNCEKELDRFYNMYCEECEEAVCMDCAIYDDFCFYCKNVTLK